MADYLSLEQASKLLGIPADRLIDLRSQGQVRGFRDGSSWKFPATEIDRLKDELPNLSGFGSGVLAKGGSGLGSKSGSVLGGDSDVGVGGDSGSGSDLELGLEISSDGGSDVNLIANDLGEGSDVLVVANDSSSGASGTGLGGKDSRLSLDLDDLNLSGSAISHDSGELDLGLSKEAVMKPAPRPLTSNKSKGSDLLRDSSLSLDVGSDDLVEIGSELDLGSDDDRSSVADDYGMPTPPIQKVSLDLDDESGDALLSDFGADSDVAIDLGQVSSDDNASRLELMDDLDMSDSADSMASRSSAGDVLSELDLLANDAMGSGLISGSANLLSGSRAGGSSVDDALADDDDLIIADDDDDLVVSSMGSDISIAGDSGINLMSPSDSGLSLESEPLDLAGSSISALDLGAELGDGSGLGSGSGRSGAGRSGAGRSGNVRRSGLVAGDAMGSGVDFQADEEFQLSPSGISLEKDDSGSQVIDIEDSEAIDMDDDAFANEGFGGGFDDGIVAEADPVDDGFGGGMVASDGDAFEPEEESGLVASGAAVRGGVAAYEIPFTLLQNLSLVCILVVMSLGGMLMTDMVRNMWAYNEVEAPVSALTNALIGAMGYTP